MTTTARDDVERCPECGSRVTMIDLDSTDAAVFDLRDENARLRAALARHAAFVAADDALSGIELCYIDDECKHSDLVEARRAKREARAALDDGAGETD